MLEIVPASSCYCFAVARSVPCRPCRRDLLDWTARVSEFLRLASRRQQHLVLYIFETDHGAGQFSPPKAAFVSNGGGFVSWMQLCLSTTTRSRQQAWGRVGIFSQEVSYVLRSRRAKDGKCLDGRAMLAGICWWRDSGVYGPGCRISHQRRPRDATAQRHNQMWTQITKCCPSLVW